MAVAVSLGIALPAVLTESGGEAVPAKPPGRALALDGMTVGSEPLHGYLAGAEFRKGPERQVFALESEAAVTELVALSGGYLLSTFDEWGGQQVRFVADDGTASRGWAVERDSFHPTVVASSDHRLGAFVQPDGTSVVVQDGGRTVTELPAPRHAFDIGFAPLAVTGSDSAGADADCALVIRGAVVTRSGGVRTRTWTLRPGRPSAAGPRGISDVDAVAGNGYSAGTVTLIEDGDGACAGVADPQGSVLWTTCQDRLLSFSPDSTWALATTSARTGSGDHELTVLDARTGSEKLRLRTARNVGIHEMVWEDDDHVLAVVSDWKVEATTEEHVEHRWAVVRISLDGTREYAVAPVPGGDEDYDGPLDLPQG